MAAESVPKVKRKKSRMSVGEGVDYRDANGISGEESESGKQPHHIPIDMHV